MNTKNLTIKLLSLASLATLIVTFLTGGINISNVSAFGTYTLVSMVAIMLVSVAMTKEKIELLPVAFSTLLFFATNIAIGTLSFISDTIKFLANNTSYNAFRAFDVIFSLLVAAVVISAIVFAVMAIISILKDKDFSKTRFGIITGKIMRLENKTEKTEKTETVEVEEIV